MDELEVRFTIKGQTSETSFALVKDDDKYQLVGKDAEGELLTLKLERDSDTGLLALTDKSRKRLSEEDDIITERLDELSSELTDAFSQGLDISDNSDDGSAEISYTPSQIYIENKPFSLIQLMDLIRYGDLEIAPTFQRNFIWDKTRQSRLIESILLGLPLPSMYLSQYDDGRLTIVDGLQRINTIKNFVEDRLRLCNMEYLRDCNGFTFEELKTHHILSLLQIRRFHQTQIMCFVIDYRSPSELKYDLFRRLNTGGKVLNDQEIRNCMSRPVLQETLNGMSSLPSFLNATHYSVKNTRMAAQEAALKFIYFYDEYSDKHPIGEYDGRMSKALDRCVENLNEASEKKIKKYIDIYDQCMQTTFNLFGEYSFRKIKDDGRKRPINKLLMLVISVLVAKHCDEYQSAFMQKKDTEKILTNEMKELLQNDKYLNSYLSLHTSSKINIEYVFKCIKKQLFDRFLLNHE